MSIHVALNHVTHYHYDRPVGLGPQVIRLRPAPHSRTRILSYSMRVEPAKHFINWQQDPQSNYLARLVFPEKTSELRIEVDLVAEMAVLNPFDFFLEPNAEQYPFEYDESLAHELGPYRLKQPLTPRFEAYLASISRAKKRTADFLVELNQRLQKDVAYLIRMEPGVQTPEETLVNASGSCRDSGWLLVQLLRHLGLAARFVSGYLIQLKPDVKSLDGPSGSEVDFTDLHAWCEVYLPGAGWIGLDPTSGLLAGEGHIPLACSPDPSSAAPVEGAIDECETTFEHHMSVTREWEAPRVTKPYTEEQWASIDALGRRVDADLQRDDVRLTQGGEPTFVSIDDRDGAEWNTEALGPTKRLLASDLLARLKRKYGANGMLHYGQGKWYPGEQLPRWSLNLYWRKDGEPVWSDPQLFADEHKHYGVDAVQAQRFLTRLAERLGLDAQYAFPAYEDVWYYLWRERRLPVNVDPFDARLDDPMERDRIRHVFEQGLDAVVGHVLPIAHNDASRPTASGWRTGPWFLRDDRCYLMPGDSPMGYRLPLDSQPWVDKIDYPYQHAVDPTQALPALPPHALLREPLAASALARSAQRAAPLAWQAPLTAEEAESLGRGKGRAARAPDDATQRPAPFESAAGLTRTALCVQPRDGRLYIFMPPLAELEHYLELVAAIEATAAELQLPVILEGYEPPRDARLAVLRVTPDPGVIEVNIHPASSWDELVDQATFLYDAAFESRLSTEKFMLDGRHTGTGGGNHFVLGGATPNDSPFLRRPDLLASMIGYWHNHPALSYVFSGLFIGPTSQAPRIDEARNDSVYEIEVAFAELQRVTHARGRQMPAVDHRPAAAQPAHRRDRQHAPRRVLHRQAVFARRHGRAARPAGDARVRDAAACTHEPHAAVADARADRALLARAVPARAAQALGHRAARPLHAAVLRVGRPARRGRRDERVRLRDGPRMVRAALRVSLPARRRVQRARRRRRAAHGARAVARDGRGGRRRRRGALRRFDGRARAGAGHRPRRRPSRAHLQRPPRAAAAHRQGRRIRRRGALSRVDCGIVAASDDRRARAADLRRARHVDEPLDGRLPVPRVASRRLELQHLPRQRLRGRGAAPGAFLQVRALAGHGAGAGRRAQPQLPVHARHAPAVRLIRACSE